MSGHTRILGKRASTAPENIACVEDSNLCVVVQDQTTPPLDLFFLKADGPPTTLATATSIDDTSIFVNTTTLFDVDDTVGVFSGADGEGRFYFGDALSVNATTGEIGLDTPLDFAFEVGDNVIAASKEMNVDGSTTPQIFSIRSSAQQQASTLKVDVTRIMIQMITNGAVGLDKFGDIASGLTKGIVLRRNNGVVNNIFNVKTNAEFANLAYDFTPFIASNPGQDVNGFSTRLTFAGQDKHGVAIRLEGGDALELIIQDDLTSLLQFRIIAEGHIVQ
jgi:hypothetical protein